MELWEFTCQKSDYKASFLLGTQNPDQTFADLNEDFAYYRLFLCPVDKTLHSFNVHDREFDGNCPEHKTKLEPISDLPKTCPKCGGAITITKKDILKSERGEMTE